MPRTILVTGGTGTLGRQVVRQLADAGHDVHALSRRPGPGGPPGATRTAAVDLSDGVGLDAALDGVHTVVHCATTSPKGDLRAATNLIAAARRADIQHLVYISIVGVDRVPLGYYQAKLAIERAIERSGLDWTLLRTTQFHDLIAWACAQLARSPVMPVPAGVPMQPIHSGEVAARLAELATGPPQGRADDMGGPRVHQFAELARAYLRSNDRRRALLPVRLPGRIFAAYRAGGHLAPEYAVGTVTFDDFLTDSTPGAADPTVPGDPSDQHQRRDHGGEGS